MGQWKFIGDKNHIGTFQEIKSSNQDGVYCLVSQTALDGKEISFLDMIQDERYASLGFWVSEEAFYQCGGINDRLSKGRNYELLLRLSKRNKVICMAVKEKTETEWEESDFYTDAYIVSLYAKELNEAGTFDLMLKNLVQYLQSSSESEEKKFYLEEMLGKTESYQRISRGIQPILVLKGKNFCYNILNDMAEGLAEGLKQIGKQTEVIELSAEDKETLVDIVGRSYQAIIGFQSFWTSIYLKDRQCYLADLLNGPKLEMVFDHPFWFPEQLRNHCSDFYILTHDENYVKFVSKYGKDIDGGFLLPPGGRCLKETQRKRGLNVVFLGTYNDYRNKLSAIYQAPKEIRKLAARYLWYLRNEPNWPAEKAFEMMTEDYGLVMDDTLTLQRMYQMGDVCQCIMYYFREKMIRTLLDSGIEIHVYGKSWQKSPFYKSAYLICHNDVQAEHSGEVLLQTKISLNILAWHKGGCNERIMNSMLAGAAVITDESSYIRKHFTNGKELCYFNLKNLEELPGMVRGLLEDEKLCRDIANAGREKAEADYSYKRQAERIFEILKNL